MRSFRTLLAAAVLVALEGAAAHAAGDSFPDLRGTWTVQGKALVMGAGIIIRPTARSRPHPGQPRLRDFVAKLQITANKENASGAR